MKKFGKKYKEAAAKFDAEKLHALEDAMQVALDSSVTKFDGTVEVHMNLNADPKYADQIVRATVALPHGTGKDVKVAAFVNDELADKAKKAGAYKAGGEEFIAEVARGNVDFDMAVATPDMMRHLAKAAKVLGPKGMMPNPKSGTVTPDIEKVIGELKAGKIEFKTDKAGIIHTIVGKVSFGKDKLLENFKALMAALLAAKPSGIKGTYIKNITLTTTMGPGIKVDVADASASK